MKAATCFLFACSTLSALALPQSYGKPDAHVPYEIEVTPSVAEKLLIHKEEVQSPHYPMQARVMGTVVIAVEIGKEGTVLYAKVISGPKMLRQPILDAVRKYRYKPYLFNGKPAVFDTKVSVTYQTD